MKDRYHTVSDQVCVEAWITAVLRQPAWCHQEGHVAFPEQECNDIIIMILSNGAQNSVYDTGCLTHQEHHSSFVSPAWKVFVWTFRASQMCDQLSATIISYQLVRFHLFHSLNLTCVGSSWYKKNKTTQFLFTVTTRLKTAALCTSLHTI